MEKRKAEENLCRDVILLHIELDPYGTDDAKEWGESDQEFADRITCEMMNWGDDLAGNLWAELENLADMTGNGSEEAGKVEALKARFKSLFE